MQVIQLTLIDLQAGDLHIGRQADPWQPSVF